MKYLFVVGDHSCSIPPEDRVSEYDCEEWRPPKIEDIAKGGEVSSSTVNHAMADHAAASPPRRVFTGFTFRVLHAVTLRRVSVARHLLSGSRAVKVTLSPAGGGPPLLATTLTREDLAANHSLAVSRSVTPHLLSKGFEGSLELAVSGGPEGLWAVGHFCSFSWNMDNGVVAFLTVRTSPGDQPVPFREHLCAPLAMVFTIYDPEALVLHVKERSARQDAWNGKLRKLNHALMSEMAWKNDILLLDVEDTYRNLPSKMLAFYEMAYKEFEFSYLLKTDDDTFVDVKKVVKTLEDLQESEETDMHARPGPWIWSCFREFWPVQAHGKWAEPSYRSLTYPPFPCGAGYVLSRDTVRFLALNAREHLHARFQGEDVSLGIWLAGVNPERYVGGAPVNGTVPCEWTHGRDRCTATACNKAQLSIVEMYNTWNLLNLCGNMCACT
ncbi:UDP-GalNAc:beta-1,3-N-acetylgalactosaminyltransferase 2-like isoform X2 [Bacillus rossius redtenbacheri]